MRSLYSWHYEKVPLLGTVIVSPKAMHRLQEASVAPDELAEVLELGTDTKAVGKAYSGVREYQGIRLEIVTHHGLDGKRAVDKAAAVVVNGYRVKS